LLTDTHAGLATLKLSESIVYGVCELEVADEVNPTETPVQMLVGETDAVTAVGTGKTVAITAVRVAEEHPVVVLRAAAK
jgi:hypothetical protein